VKKTLEAQLGCRLRAVFTLDVFRFLYGLDIAVTRSARHRTPGAWYGRLAEKLDGQ
jgi:hypothetical protein